MPDGNIVPVRPLAWPPELPEAVAENPRVMRLIDVDSVSHGLADGTSLSRAPDRVVQHFLDIVQATARARDPQSRVRYASSSVTAAHHLDVLTAVGNNEWTIRRGLDGADHVLLEEMGDLISGARQIATTPGHVRAARRVNLVILAGQDHIYAPRVRQLRLLGIPTWLIVPGRQVAARLYSSACAVSFIDPPFTAPGPFPARRKS
jgi:hypothetical protein